MTQLSAPVEPPTTETTQHALLVVWGHFAQTLDLPARLARIPLAQKTVKHTPAAKLLTLFLSLLSGNEYLSDLSSSAAPLYRDPALPAAWGLPALAEASGVSRTLAAADITTLAALQTALDTVTQPFLDRAVADLRNRNHPLVLDADLTGRPVSSSSTTYPEAAFGYMDGPIRLGYQVAVLCLQTDLYGRQWRTAQQHPGDTVSAPCLVDLVVAAEQRLGCHPVRRPDLVDRRIRATPHQLAQAEQRIAATTARIADLMTREEAILATLTTTQAALYTTPPAHRAVLLHQVRANEQRLGRLRQRWAPAVTTVKRTQPQAAALHRQLRTLQTRRDPLAAENAAQPTGPRCILRLDAGFSSGANLTFLLEQGYAILTKSANAALLTTLLSRVTSDTVWTRVGRNAEMVCWPDYRLTTCPYPLTVGVERFHTPQGQQYAVLLRSQPTLALRRWFHEYNARQTVEAGIKQSKTVFHIQHPMSHRLIGMQIQLAFTMFAANFIPWAQLWLQGQTVETSEPPVRGLTRLKALVRVAANSPAAVEHYCGQTLVRFGPTSSLPGVVIGITLAAIQLALPLFGW